MFDKYHNYLLVSKDIFNQEHQDLYLKKDIYYPLSKEEKELVDIKLIINDSQDIYKIVIMLNNSEIYQENVYKKDVKKTIEDNISIWEKIANFFHKIF